MRRSVLFFTFVLAAIGCGSDPATDSGSEQEQNPSDPGIETGIRPPIAVGIDEVVRIDEGSRVDDAKVAARKFSDRAVMQSPYRLHCPSPPLCLEVYRRQGADP